jgi:hypothetical protein
MTTTKTKKIVILLLIIFILQLIISSNYKSISGDETFHTSLGYFYVKGKYNTEVIEHLSFDKIYGIVPLLYKVPLPEDATMKIDFFELAGKNIDKIIFFNRLIAISIAALLGYFIFKWGKELYGEKAGLFALLLYVFSPNILGNSNIIMTDITITCFLFIATYYLWKLYKEPSTKNLILAGITFGISQITKLTAINIIPIFFIIIAFIILFNKKNSFKKILTSSSKWSLSLLTIFFIGFLVIWASYDFQFDVTMPHLLNEVHGDQEIINQGIESIPNNQLKNIVTFTLNKIPIPTYTYFTSFYHGLSHARQGHPYQFFMGMHTQQGEKQGWWNYYFTAFLIKTPIPTIIFFIAAIVYSLSLIRKRESNKNELFLLTPIIFFFIAFSFFSSFNVGIVHILPIYPFIFVYSSKLVNLKSKKATITIILLILWYIIVSLLIFPHHLAYFNEFVGVDNGYKYLVDSNLDLGQDLKGLKEYMTENNIDKIKLAYFGTDKPKHYNINHENLLISEGKANCNPSDGLIAISVTHLQNVYFDNKTCFNWLKQFEPIDKIGYSIHIYNITYCEEKDESTVHGIAVKKEDKICMI